MAIIKSHLVSEIRGTVGGITYFSGVGHPILARAYFKPTNRNTEYQQKVRSAVQASVMAWQLISDANRNKWENYATAMGMDGLGRRLFVGGYSKAEFLRLSGGDVIVVDSGPSATALFNVTITNVVPLVTPGTGFQFSINNLEPDDDGFYQLNLAGPFSPARFKYKGPFMGETIALDGLTADTSTNVEVSGLVEDGVYFVKIRCVTAAETAGDIPHRLSSQTIIRAIATTTPA
jgi:hypothetical protein